jgi:hypothetical protein
VLVRGDDSRLDRWQESRQATQSVREDGACQMCLDGGERTRGIKVAVVETVGQQHDIRGEPITADVAAFPDQFRPSGRQSSGDRTPTERATHVVYAVCADEYDRLGSCRANRVAIECGSCVQQVVVVSPRTSDRVDIQAGKDPAARCAPIDPARATHQ